MNNGIILKKYEKAEFLTPLQDNLIKILNEEGPITRRSLVKLLETPRTTIYDNLAKLEKRKVVERTLRNNGKRGRPIVLWKLKD